MAIMFPDHEAVTPAGKPIGAPIPVAPVVVKVIGVNTVFIHIGEVLGAAVTVLFGFTVIVPVAFTKPQPPVNGIL